MRTQGSHSEASRETSPADTLILDLQPLELWDSKFLLSKPPDLWCSVVATSISQLIIQAAALLSSALLSSHTLVPQQVKHTVAASLSNSIVKETPKRTEQMFTQEPVHERSQQLLVVVRRWKRAPGSVKRPMLDLGSAHDLRVMRSSSMSGSTSSIRFSLSLCPFRLCSLSKKRK